MLRKSPTKKIKTKCVSVCTLSKEVHVELKFDTHELIRGKGWKWIMIVTLILLNIWLMSREGREQEKDEVLGGGIHGRSCGSLVAQEKTTLLGWCHFGSSHVQGWLPFSFSFCFYLHSSLICIIIFISEIN